MKTQALSGSDLNATQQAEALRSIGEEIRRIGNNVNQIARALNVAAHTGEYPPHQGQAAAQAVQEVRAEMRRLVAVYTGNFDYWGLPDAERPTAAPGAFEAEQQKEVEGRGKRRLRARRRPHVFEQSAPERTS